MSITPRKCKAAALATAPVAAALGAYGFLKGATKFYSSQVNGTPEQYKMTLPGDDLVPEGSPRFKRLTHVEDLDAPATRSGSTSTSSTPRPPASTPSPSSRRCSDCRSTTPSWWNRLGRPRTTTSPVTCSVGVTPVSVPRSPTWSPASIWCGSLTPVTAPGHRAQVSCYRLECRGTAGVGSSPWNPRQWQPDAHLLPVEHLGLRGVQSDLGLPHGSGHDGRRRHGEPSDVPRAGEGCRRNCSQEHRSCAPISGSWASPTALTTTCSTAFRTRRSAGPATSSSGQRTGLLHRGSQLAACPGEEYHADIEGNNARNGWTEDTPAANDAEAERRAKELAAHLDEMARGRRTAR